MCGIHGFVDFKLKQEEALRTITSMVETTLHRGPDTTHFVQIGEVALGHNRLSIIDLSDSGKQPMQRNQLTIVFNGEIYNYKEVRNELINSGHVFKTDSDTEVILVAYEEWGQNCVNHFMGMWSFALWDDTTKKLFCSRDRFGIKPFYYIEQNGRIYFASEVKSLKKSPLFSNDLNLNQVSRSMQLGWTSFQHETMYSTVNILEPGHSMTLQDGALAIFPYWEISAEQSDVTSYEDAVEKFRLLFIDSLRMHMRSDVPVGATLSGGIDSSSIVTALIHELGITDLQTFSIYYEGKDAVDERPFIREIEAKYGGKFQTHFYSPDLKQVEQEFHAITHHCDFPVLGSSPISQYFVMKEISRTGIKVILSGQGADDYLGGYMHTYYRFYAEMLRSAKFGRFFHELKMHRQFQHLSFMELIQVVLKSFLSTTMSEQQLYQLEYKKYYPTMIQGIDKTPLELNRLSSGKVNNFHHQLMTTSSLPSLLHYEDRNSMAFSIESRVPFLDHRLIDFAFGCPAEFKIRNGYTKSILRDAMKNYLPSAIHQRKDKKGFVTPGEVKWLRGQMKHLLEIDYNNLDFIHKKNVSAMIDAFQKGDNSNASAVWRIASLNYWIKEHLS